MIWGTKIAEVKFVSQRSRLPQSIVVLRRDFKEGRERSDTLRPHCSTPAQSVVFVPTMHEQTVVPELAGEYSLSLQLR